MPKGSKWEIVAPADLAYGSRGTHGKIGPNATLIFTIELVNVEKSPSKSYFLGARFNLTKTSLTEGSQRGESLVTGHAVNPSMGAR